MEQKSISKNYIFNLSYQILLYVVPFVTTPYLSRVLAAEGVGRYSFAQSIVSYFVLAATMGTTLYGQRKIASLRRDPVAQTAAFLEIFLLRIATTSAALLIYALVVLPLCGNPALYLVAALDIVAVGVDLSGFFQGQEEFGVIAGCNGLCKLASVALIFLCVKSAADLNRYVLIYCGTAVLGFISEWLFVPRHFVHGCSIDLHMPFRHIRPALSLFVAQVAMQVYTVLDKTMIGVITRSDIQNGYYEQAQKLIHVLLAFATSLGTVMASRMVMLWKEGRRDAIQEMIEVSFRMTAAVGLPIAAGVMLIAHRFVPIFYGDGFAGVVPLLYVLAALIPIIGCSNVLGVQYLIPTGQERFLTYSVLAGSATNVVLNALLISRFQAVGAAIASVLAESCVTAVQIHIVQKEELNLKPLAGIFARYLVCCLPMAGVGVLVERVAPQGIPGLALIIAVCAATYGAVLLLIRDPVVETLRIQIRQMRR